MNIMAGGLIAVALIWVLVHRRSAAVARWRAPALPRHRGARLHFRSGGGGDEAVILLHGLVSSGDLFGADYDTIASTRRLVVPDLLGFGRSMDESRDSFSIDDHLDALDQMADQAGLFGARWTIGAHSMGCAIALRWAARHLERIDRIVCWGAPIYPSPDAVRAHISGNLMARLFVLDTRWAHRACAVSCRHRSAGGWLTAALEPALPVAVARAVPLHTWPAYRDAMSHLVINTDWQHLLTELEEPGISTEFVWGTRDRVGDHGHARSMAANNTMIDTTFIEGADHHLPMSHPEICLTQLLGRRGDEERS